MDTSMTFGQFISFCENYEYSKEYFELFKEEKELALIEMHLDNQAFIRENADQYRFSEGFLSESVDDDIYERMPQAYMEKARDFGNKVWGAIKKAGEAFCKFLYKVFGIMINNDVVTKETLKFFTGKFATLTEGAIVKAASKAKLYNEEKLKHLLGALSRREEAKASASPVVREILVDIAVQAWGYDDPSARKSESSIATRQEKATDTTAITVPKQAKPYVQAALTRETITIALTGKRCPIANEVLDAFSAITEGKHDPKDIALGLKNASGNTVDIQLNDKAFKKTKEKIDKLSKQLQGASIPGAEVEGSKVASAINELNTLMHDYVATLTKVYNKVATFRKKAITAYAKLARAC